MDPTLPASDVADLAGINQRAATLTRTLQVVPLVLPMLVVGGNARDTGYWSTSSTSFVEMMQFETFVTGQWLWYTATFTAAYGAATSIEWQIQAVYPISGFSTVTLASGSAASGDTITGVVDLFAASTRNVLSNHVSIRLSIKRTGGAGDGAAVRIPRLWMLRNVAS